YESVSSKSGTRCHRSSSTTRVPDLNPNYFRSHVDFHLTSYEREAASGCRSHSNMPVAARSGHAASLSNRKRILTPSRARSALLRQLRSSQIRVLCPSYEGSGLLSFERRC